MLYPDKSGTVAELLNEARKHVELSDDGTGKLRLLEVSSNKISQILTEDVILECLNPMSNKVYRIEEIPKDETIADPSSEFIIPVAHFHKDIFQTFGTPFLLKLREVSKHHVNIMEI